MKLNVKWSTYRPTTSIEGHITVDTFGYIVNIHSVDAAISVDVSTLSRCSWIIRIYVFVISMVLLQSVNNLGLLICEPSLYNSYDP